MAGHSLNALQKAVHQALAADSTLTALVTGIYDAVPENTTYPYMTWGVASCENMDSLGSHRERIRMNCEVYSRTHGRKQTQTILDRVHTLLQHAGLTMDAGFTLLQIECENGSSALLGDGLTWRGTLAIEAIVQ